MYKSVLITGSSKGLGECLAFQFVNKGYDVLLHGRDLAALKKTQKTLQNYSSNSVSYITGELSKTETLDLLAYRIGKDNIDTLVNNAGVCLQKDISDLTEKELRDVIEINFFAPALLMKKVIPIFTERGSGTIVNINSVAGKQGSARESAYAASKYALRGFSTAVKGEVAKKGIRIIDIYPNAIQTDMTKERKNFPYFMKPEEVAKTIIHAVCDEHTSEYVSELDIERRNYG